MKITPEISPLVEYLNKFVVLSEREVKSFLSKVQYKTCKKGDILLKEGDVCNEIYFILQGTLRAYTKVTGEHNRTFNFAFDGTIFTEQVSFALQQPSTDYLDALEDCKLLYITYERLTWLFEKFHGWERAGRIINQIYFCDERNRVRSFMLDDATLRYKKLLIEFPAVEKKIPQHIIASYLNITPQSLSRLKKVL
ncbi:MULTISPECIES: cyclic nucleotide-binding domain-containing protein [unclassified Arcicella]|uniref:Crp/Fnr family transcriptional regulator n=1 Tax=unclassified Arcicella TaxID=2644986 RepID=UPI00285D7636|nr:MULTISPECIES: cyclic nucleotide-binding domain-containing protein [unclassified Arcicella]MDR6562517.1 CRP-like cAMP-binding protein [Arcicella sp. BE51]MDR6812604.1 CRP-like cAMP-binding protein [Arcicella sp. BE140]MDR6823916.1 CRP-like cAMP-binding protein [Arcicella sp. BE139]